MPTISSVSTMQPDGSIQVVLDPASFPTTPMAVNYWITADSTQSLAFQCNPWDGNFTRNLGDGSNASVSPWLGKDIVVAVSAFFESDQSDPSDSIHVTLPAPSGLTASVSSTEDGYQASLACSTIPGGNSGSVWYNNGIEIGRNPTPPAASFVDDDAEETGDNNYMVAWIDMAGVVGPQCGPVAA